MNSFQKIFNHYGEDNQKLKLAEECAELIQAVLKKDDANFIEEMADVQVLINQFCSNREIDWQVTNFISRKVDRTLKRIQKENP